jgi:hypothetical protein
MERTGIGDRLEKTTPVRGIGAIPGSELAKSSNDVFDDNYAAGREETNARRVHLDVLQAGGLAVDRRCALSRWIPIPEDATNRIASHRTVRAENNRDHGLLLFIPCHDPKGPVCTPVPTNDLSDRSEEAEELADPSVSGCDAEP